MTSFTANWLPSSTICPSGRYSKGLRSWLSSMAARIFLATAFPSCKAACAVGGRDRLAVLLRGRDGRTVSQCPHARPAFYPQAAVYYHPVSLGQREVELLYLCVWASPCGPDDVLGGDLRSVFKLHAVLRNLLSPNPSHDLDAAGYEP